jgi:hypothetical protein
VGQCWDSESPFVSARTRRHLGALHALIIVLVFSVLALVIAVVVWPVCERAGVGASVFAFALIG